MAIDSGLRANRLLALLPPDELARLEPRLAVVDGRDHDMIYEDGRAASFGYFPLSSVLSLIATDADGRGVEMASVGREGLVGLPGALGGGSMIGQVVQQISGRNARIEIRALRDEVRRRGRLAEVIELYAVGLLSQIGQTVVCNRHHPLESRAARWLLATHDRVGQDEFVLTQDFLSIMLGVTRPQVSIAAAALKRAGLIDYSRGRLRVIDRKGLEAASCECYRVIEGEFDRLLGTDGSPTRSSTASTSSDGR
jgi:CRP-like cAMP-binding protein